MPTWIEIATSWTLVSLIVGLGGYYYYTSTQPTPRRSSLSRQAVQPLQSTVKKDKPKKTKTKQVLDNAKETIKETLPSIGLVTGADVPVQPQSDSNAKRHKKNISEDDKTFAQALQKQQVGTSFGGSERVKQKPRTQKQGKAMEKEEILHVGGGAAQKVITTNNEVVEPYGDAVTNDEPISPVTETPTSEEHETVTEESFPALNDSYGGASGVEDMLEASAPGPSVLRMTAPTEQWSTVSKKKNAKPSTNTSTFGSTTTTSTNARPTEETKKQRQARQRRENEKAAIAESEAVRKQLEEKQRRTAREARGEPSRNGESIAKNSAWKGGANGSGATNKQQALFDTFEMEAP